MTSDSATGGLTKCTAVLVYHLPDDQFLLQVGSIAQERSIRHADGCGD